ncbi:MAG TPA: hypothetical protein PKY35_10210 [Candidatus Hydrogenedentes bacterium]|nr:hypothetical protein [Candidatus Hydrogenedentota bacterium]HOL77393.1 hypothetical protein [Candidatus Hydrogenedentota bacterium]HPO87588.1 hypothetical protein [Candidatus Hydrogenedentota bacterium]
MATPTAHSQGVIDLAVSLAPGRWDVSAHGSGKFEKFDLRVMPALTSLSWLTTGIYRQNAKKLECCYSWLKKRNATNTGWVVANSWRVA